MVIRNVVPYLTWWKTFKGFGGYHTLTILTIYICVFFSPQIDNKCRMPDETRQFPDGWPFLSSEVRQLWGLYFIYADYFIPQNTKAWFETLFLSKRTWQFYMTCLGLGEEHIPFLEEHWSNPFFKNGFHSLFTVRWLNKSNREQNGLFKGFLFVSRDIRSELKFIYMLVYS